MRMLFIVGAALVALVGCAPFPYTEVPLATNFETTKQLKLQAAHHWQVIANSAADALYQTLDKEKIGCILGKECQWIYVVPTNPRSAFGRAFHNLFVSRLVSKGQKVTSNRDDAVVVVELDAHTVRFGANRRQYLGLGRLTMLAVGLWGLHEINEHQTYDRPAAALVAAGVAADIYDWGTAEFAKGPTPQFELVLTASATRGTQYVARSTSVYYIADGDTSLYCWKEEGCGEPVLVVEKPAPASPCVAKIGSPCEMPCAACTKIQLYGDCGVVPCRARASGDGAK